MLWGAIVCLHAACSSFGGLATVRFLLGWIEVCTAPATILITSNFYTKNEQIARVALWVSVSRYRLLSKINRSDDRLSTLRYVVADILSWSIDLDVPSQSGAATAIGAFFAWCFTYAPTDFAWQGLYIYWGLITFCAGVACFFFLAPTPAEASWLSEEEKVIALERVRGNKTGSEIWDLDRKQLAEVSGLSSTIVWPLLLTNRLLSGLP